MCRRWCIRARVNRWSALLVVVAASAGAQSFVPGFELERLSLNPGARETMVLGTGDGLEAKSLRVALLGHYESAPLVLTVNGQAEGAYIRERVTTHLLAAYGITHWAEVSLSLPVVVAQGGVDLSSRGLQRPPSFAMGAPWIAGRFTFLREEQGRPVDLSAQLGLSLPLGSSEALTRDPGAGLALAPRVGVGRRLGPTRLGAEAGVLIRGSQALNPQVSNGSDVVGSGFTGGVALSTPGLPVNLELTFRGEVPFTRAPAAAELLLGARYVIAKQFELSLLGGPGIGHTPGTPAFRVLGGVAWRPSFETAAPQSDELSPSSKD